MRSLRGRAAVTVIVRDIARVDRLTAMVLVQGQPLAELSRYLRERNLSLKSEERVARAVVLFVEFCEARAQEFAQRERRGELMNSFAHALRYGTMRDGEDLSGLWWLPMKAETLRAVAGAVCQFSDWLVEKHGAKPLNPLRPASPAEKIVFWRKWNRMNATGLLAHLDQRSSRAEEVHVRRFALPTKVPATSDRPPYFPPDRFDELLTRGFIRRGTSGSVPCRRARWAGLHGLVYAAPEVTGTPATRARHDLACGNTYNLISKV